MEEEALKDYADFEEEVLEDYADFEEEVLEENLEGRRFRAFKIAVALVAIGGGLWGGGSCVVQMTKDHQKRWEKQQQCVELCHPHPLDWERPLTPDGQCRCVMGIELRD
jgi:hypothetical protein